MSDEYRISMDGAVLLGPIAEHLSTFGLRVVNSNDDLLWLSYEQVDQEQLKRWGGNVRIEREGEGLFVTLNATANRKGVISAIKNALAAQGVGATIEEL
jgi:hypothetical protein